MSEERWSIGSVSHATGVPTETLRTWERRYGVVEPARDDRGRRVYAWVDVERLRVIAQLVHDGARVSDLAKLDLEALQRYRGVASPEPLPSPRSGMRRFAACHPAGRAVAEASARWSLVGSSESLADLGQAGAELLLVELAWLRPDAVSVLEDFARAHRVVIVATFQLLSRSQRRRLEAIPELHLVAGPLQAHELVQAFDLAVRETRTGGIAASPRYSREQLDRILNLRPDLLCECPNHLARLLVALGDFETYSRRCVVEGSEDEALHRGLAEGTGRARVEMEALLAQVLAFEGIAI